MPNRQRIVFTIGCYLAFLTAALHMVGHVSGPQAAANDTERQLLDLMTTYALALPGVEGRTMMDLMNGFSLIFSVMLALSAGLGLIVLRRSDDLPQLLATARALAAAYGVMLAISLTHFFIIPTICLAAIALCFAMASVRPPAA
jgi:hypothetical protein